MLIYRDSIKVPSSVWLHVPESPWHESTPPVRFPAQSWISPSKISPYALSQKALETVGTGAPASTSASSPSGVVLPQPETTHSSGASGSCSVTHRGWTCRQGRGTE